MRIHHFGIGLIVVAALLLAAPASGNGADVMVWDLHDLGHWTASGPLMENGVAYRSYTVGTVACNNGNVQLDWVASTNKHPIIATGMYRLYEGRFEQIGMSWLKHGFCALQNSGGCQPCQPAGGGCTNKLGIGCTDPYSAFNNAEQARLGPRWQVNAATGVFPYPHATQGQTGNAAYKRLKVKQDDMNATLLPGARFFLQGMYIHIDDATAGNQNNNASYRPINISSNYLLSFAAPVVREVPAIFAWREHGLGLNQPDTAVLLQAIDVPGDGRFWFGQKVTNVGNGQWSYEIAIQNFNSDRSGGSLVVPVPPDVSVTDQAFHDVDYHSGEPFDNTDWLAARGGDGSLLWHSPVTYEIDPNTNALRFDTIYNFRFIANTPPRDGTITLGLFKPGTPDEVLITALVPRDVGCVGDVAGNGGTSQADLGVLLAAFGSCPGDANYNAASGYLAGGPCVTQEDLGVLLGDFGCR